MKRSLRRDTMATIVVSIFVLAATSIAKGYEWQVYNDHLYTLTQGYGTWQESENEAVLAGGHLATINDVAENRWLTNFAEDSYTRSHPYDPAHNLVWIGLNDHDQDGMYRWVSGEPMSYTNLDPHSWANSLGNCVYLMGSNHPYTVHTADGGSGYWSRNNLHNDDFGSNPLGIIELPIYQPPPQPQPDPQDPPPPELIRNHFVVGMDPYVSVEPLTVGADFNFGVPGIGTIEYHPSMSIPEDPLSADIDPIQFGFTTNEFCGNILRHFTPISETIEVTGTLRLSGDADLNGQLHLTEGSVIAGIEATVGAGVNLAATVQVEGSLTALPIVGSYLHEGVTFSIPLAGTPTYEFDTDIGLPVPSDRTESVLLGVSACVYAESSITAGAEFYLREQTTEDFANMLFQDVLPGTFSDPLDWSNAPHLASDTGTIDLSAGDLRMETGSSVWISSLITVTGMTDMLFFKAEFMSDLGAEGLLQVYWEEELIGMIDEREALEGLQHYFLALPGTYEVGVYNLSFRLDPYNDAVASSILIDAVTTGYVVPEPSTFVLAALALLGLGWYAWRTTKQRYVTAFK